MTLFDVTPSHLPRRRLAGNEPISCKMCALMLRRTTMTRTGWLGMGMRMRMGMEMGMGGPTRRTETKPACAAHALRLRLRRSPSRTTGFFKRSQRRWLRSILLDRFLPFLIIASRGHDRLASSIFVLSLSRKFF